MKGSKFALCLLAVQGGRCFHCDRQLEGTVTKRPKPGQWTRDHLVPLARGGLEYRNIVLACRTCNQAKGSEYPAADLIERAAANYDTAFWLWCRFMSEGFGRNAIEQTRGYRIAAMLEPVSEVAA